MDSGAAILDFGGEFGPNAVSKPMSNNGPDLRDNIKPNVVTPYTKIGTPSENFHNSVAKDGYAGTTSYGANDSTSDENWEDIWHTNPPM